LEFFKRLFCRALKRVRVLFIHNPEMSSKYGTWLDKGSERYVYDPVTQRYRNDYVAGLAANKIVAKNRAKNKVAAKSRAKGRRAKR
jgi:hypothetical protein